MVVFLKRFTQFRNRLDLDQSAERHSGVSLDYLSGGLSVDIRLFSSDLGDDIERRTRERKGVAASGPVVASSWCFIIARDQDGDTRERRRLLIEETSAGQVSRWNYRLPFDPLGSLSSSLSSRQRRG